MTSKKPRQILYVCSGINNGQLLSSVLEAPDLYEAETKFETQYQIKPQSIHGPFYYRKRKTKQPIMQNMQFIGPAYSVIYNNWVVSALPLKEPPDSALLFFDRRMDGVKSKKPKRTIVKIKELQDVKKENT